MSNIVYLLTLANTINNDYVILGVYNKLDIAEDVASKYPLLDEEYLYIEEKETDKFINRNINDVDNYHYMNKSDFEF